MLRMKVKYLPLLKASATKSTHRFNQINRVRANSVGDHISLQARAQFWNGSRVYRFLVRVASAPSLLPRLSCGTIQKSLKSRQQSFLITLEVSPTRYAFEPTAKN